MGVTPGGKIGNCTCGIHHRCQNPPKKSRLLCGKNGSFRFLTRLTHYRGRIRSSEPRFRGCESVAPLKQHEPFAGPHLWYCFRGCKFAAPLTQVVSDMIESLNPSSTV